MVHILDLIGTDVKRFQSHSATVNDISIDTNGEFIASAADDGERRKHGSPDVQF